MRKAGLFVTVTLFVLWAVGLGSAQSKNLQITKGPTVEHSTSNSAIVAWSTNVNGSTVLKYGTDPNNLNQTTEAPWGGLTHRVTLNNLQPNTTYYFRVESAQGQGTGTTAMSNVSQFKTENGPASASTGSSGSAQPFNAATFKVLAGPIPQQVTDKSAKLWWETNESTSGSIVKYGTSASAMNQTAQSQSSDGLSHWAQLSNLQPGTQYFVSIWRPDGQQSTTGTFSTQPANYAQAQTVRLTNGPVVQKLSDNQAVVSWQTSAPSSSIVKYGTSPNALNQTAESAWTSGTHTVTIKNLQPNTEYWFQVESAQARGTGTATQSNAFPFWTVPSGQAAFNIAPQF